MIVRVIAAAMQSPIVWVYYIFASVQYCRVSWTQDRMCVKCGHSVVSRMCRLALTQDVCKNQKKSFIDKLTLSLDELFSPIQQQYYFVKMFHFHVLFVVDR